MRITTIHMNQPVVDESCPGWRDFFNDYFNGWWFPDQSYLWNGLNPCEITAQKQQADPIQGLPGINKALTFGRRQRWRGGSDPQINSVCEAARRADRSCLKGLLAAVRCMSIPMCMADRTIFALWKMTSLTLPAKRSKAQQSSQISRWFRGFQGYCASPNFRFSPMLFAVCADVFFCWQEDFACSKAKKQAQEVRSSWRFEGRSTQFEPWNPSVAVTFPFSVVSSQLLQAPQWEPTFLCFFGVINSSIYGIIYHQPQQTTSSMGWSNPMS